MKFLNTTTSIAIMFLLGSSETNAANLRMMQQPIKPLAVQSIAQKVAQAKNMVQTGNGNGKEFFEDMRSLQAIMNSGDTKHLAALVKEETADAKEAEADAVKAKDDAKKEEAKADKETKEKKGGADADKIAAEADKEKAKKLEAFAKEKLEELIDQLKALDDKLKGQFDKLEKLLNDQDIEAEFDPNDKKDIEWVTEEILKILEETPEIKQLEKQLGLAKSANDPLDKVIADLKKITDVSKMVKAKDAEKEKDEKKDGKKDDKKADDKKADDKKADDKPKEKKADDTKKPDDKPKEKKAGPKGQAPPAAKPKPDAPPAAKPKPDAPPAKAVQTGAVSINKAQVNNKSSDSDAQIKKNGLEAVKAKAAEYAKATSAAKQAKDKVNKTESKKPAEKAAPAPKNAAKDKGLSLGLSQKK